MGAQGEGDLAKKAGDVLGDDLEQCGVCGGLGVELEAGGDFNLQVGGVVQVAAGFEQLLHRNFLRDDVVKIGEEAVLLAGVELEGVEDVSKVEAVDDDAALIGVGAGLDDVHAPGGEGSGDVGKEAGAVAGDDGEIEELAVGVEVELDGILLEIECHLEVMADLLREAGLQIALGKAFEELSQGFVLRSGHHGAETVEEGWVNGGAVTDFVDGAVHEVGGGHIKLPDVFRFPRGERIGVDGFDVRIGHESEHFEQLGTADFVREAADIFKIEDVAAKGVGHFEMETDELEDGFALFGVEVEAGEEGIGEFDTLRGVFSGAAGLAGVVEQESKQKQVEAVDLRQKLREAMLVVAGGLAEAVDVVDGEEGVLIDGVAVIAVANDQGVDAVELGDEHFKNAEGMHGAQGVRGVGAKQDFAKGIPEVGAFGDVDGEGGERVGDSVFSGLRKRVAVGGHHGEDAEDGRGVIELSAGRDIDATLVEEEVGTRDGGAAAAELLVEADGRGEMLHEKRRASIDDARVAIVGAHPVARIRGAAGLKADGVCGGFVLGLPIEGIVVAAVAEMQETSGGGEEVEGSFGVAAGALEDAAALARPFAGFLEMKQEGEPDGEVVVAQAAGTVFQVGLEMEDGIAEAGMACAGDFAKLLGNGVPLAEHEAGKYDLVQLLVERELAGEETAIKRGEGEFEVVGVELSGLLDGAGAWAGAEADVPHALNDEANGFGSLGLDLFVGKGEEYIDVGVGEKIFAAVTAEGEEGDVERGLSGEGAAPHFDEQPVDNGGPAADGGSAVASALTGLADKRHLPQILLP